MARDGRIKLEEMDEDGYWIYLKAGWTWQGETHIIHEDTKREAHECMADVEPCYCSDECKLASAKGHAAVAV